MLARTTALLAVVIGGGGEEGAFAMVKNNIHQECRKSRVELRFVLCKKSGAEKGWRES
jgi:hypothetical protein